MLVSVLCAAILGAIGGGLGGVLGLLFDRRFRRDKPAGRISGMMVGSIAFAVIAGQSPFVEALAVRIDPLRRFASEGREILALPGMGERLRGKPPHETEAFLAQLTMAGMLRLDDAALVRRVGLLSKLLAVADERRCAAMAVGSHSSLEVARLLLELDEEDQKAWFALTRSAVRAEVGGGPLPEGAILGEEDVAEAIGVLVDPLPEEDRARLLGNLATMEALGPTEACWTGRRLYTLVDESTGETQATLARALAMQ